MGSYSVYFFLATKVLVTIPKGIVLNVVTGFAEIAKGKLKLIDCTSCPII